jgi:sec-independent protein translocase protein TatB
MIDIGLSKLALIGVVALVVIGPERLPKVARMAGSLFGRAQRYINEIRFEVSREIELEELREMRKDMEEMAGAVHSSLSESVADAGSSMHDVWNDGNGEDGDTPSPAPEALLIKAKNFRRKKLARASAASVRHRNGRRARVISAAARVARYRPVGIGKSVGFF